MIYENFGKLETVFYNSQLNVTSANNKLQNSRVLPELLARTEQLVQKFGVVGMFGVRLLHKHNNISIGERMVEFEGQYRTRTGKLVPVLETVRTKSSAVECPSIMALERDGTPIPLEYSMRISMSDTQDLAKKHGTFFKAFAELVHEYELQDVIGLYLINNEFSEKYISNSCSVLVERSDDIRDANIIFIEDPRDIDPSTVIQTSWTFTDAGIGCGSVCERQDDGGHKKVDHHPTGD